MKSMAKIIFVLLTWLVSWTALADSSPVAMLQTTSDQLLSALKANKASLKRSPQVVYDIIDKILVPRVDLEGMARTVVGRPVWTSASSTQRQAFTEQFKELLIHTYSSALSSYNNQTVQFLPIRGDINGKDRVQVNSQILQPNGPTISVSYRLVKQSNDWKVFDFSVDGISMLESFRSQFAAELNQGNIDTLINKLAQHNEQTS